MHLTVDHRRQARVRQAGDGHAGVLRQVAQVLAHLGRAGRAVQAEHVGLHRIERGQRGADLGAGQHPAGELHRHLHLQRHLDAGGLHGATRADHGGLGAEQVELRLDQDEVDAAVEQTAALLLVHVA